MTEMQRRGLRTLAMLVLALTAASITATAQTYTDLYNFGTNAGDPYLPQYTNLAQGRDGNLYGSALGGTLGYGVEFKMTTGGTLTDLLSFDGVDGAFATDRGTGGLTLGTDGNFYGTTYEGGSSTYGVVYKMAPDGTETILYNFAANNDGAFPFPPPIQGTDGNFYGTTLQGGGTANVGTVYKITPSGALTYLYKFDGPHGYFPYCRLVQGLDGNFYGTTYYGGVNSVGEVFKVTPAGKLTVLYSFDTTHGSYPVAGLTLGNDGNFYGATWIGGTSNNGVVYKITSSGKLTVLHNFNGTSDGGGLSGGLLQATDGNFYGETEGGGTNTCGPGTCGTIYKISPTGSFSVVHNFDSATGQSGQSAIFQHTSGVLYGETYTGGTGNTTACTGCGTFFSLDMGLGPFVSLMTTAGKVGATVEILGQGFTGATGVSFGGTSATTYTVVSDTYMTAVVPAGTTGSVKVMTTGGTLTSNKIFRVLPTLTSFTPPSGKVGDSVTITGTGLTQTTKVTFGGVASTSVVVNSDTQVTATVPTGAKTGKIGITTKGGKTTSKANFTVTL